MEHNSNTETLDSTSTTLVCHQERLEWLCNEVRQRATRDQLRQLEERLAVVVKRLAILEQDRYAAEQLASIQTRLTRLEAKQEGQLQSIGWLGIKIMALEAHKDAQQSTKLEDVTRNLENAFMAWREAWQQQLLAVTRPDRTTKDSAE